MPKEKIKALALLSGGLDSMLAAKILMNQGVDVTGLVFRSCFFGVEKARKAAKQIRIDLKEIDFCAEHLEMLKNPKYGYGKNMNPCVDCHAMMLRYAKEIMEKEGYDFIATGEVLGQRPMSQNMEALKTVAEYSGIGDKLVRPLSAQLLEETLPEKEGKINRGKLLNIKGRSRENQFELAQKYNLTEYPSPAGGCLLTDPEFSQRLIKMIDYWPDCGVNDVELLKHGRIFWIKSHGAGYNLIVVGRDQKDNEALEKLRQENDFLIELSGITGPTTLARIKNNEFFAQIQRSKKEKNKKIRIPKEISLSSVDLEKENPDDIIDLACLLTGYHAPKARGEEVEIRITHNA